VKKKYLFIASSLSFPIQFVNKKKEMDIVATSTNVVKKVTNAGLQGIAIGITVLSSFILLTFLFMWASFGRVYKNVHRRSRARVHVNAQREISLLDVQDPYNILKGAAYGSTENGLNQTNSLGTFFIGLPANSRYNFTKATLTLTVKNGFVVLTDIGYNLLTLSPFMVSLDEGNYLIEPISTSYDMYITIEWEQPASL
jgi:hypothetical protein